MINSGICGFHRQFQKCLICSPPEARHTSDRYTSSCQARCSMSLVTVCSAVVIICLRFSMFAGRGGYIPVPSHSPKEKSRKLNIYEVGHRIHKSQNLSFKFVGIIGIIIRCLDHNDLNNYRPVSNLCFIAKILEKLVLSQVSSYLNSHNLYNTCQSAYRPGHSTETALLKVVNDLFLSLNKGNISVLALLDFSSAFDTIDHTILVHRLHTDFGFTDIVLQWFSSYLTDRTHYVSLCNHCSDFATVHSGVPQGSVLGPMLFTMNIKPLSAIIDSHSIIHHSFADDLQLQMSAPPDRISELLHSMQSCISDVKAWATANMLKLNDSKTELMLVTSKRSKHLHNLPTSITIGNAQIPFKQSVKNLGFTLDCHLTMNAHVSNIARTCYF